MDGFWYGFAAFMEYIFELIKPIGMAVDVLFVIIGFIGTFFWLWYSAHVRKGGRNFMSDPGT